LRVTETARSVQHPSDAARKFLIVRLGSLGDVVHAIPVAAALRHSYPVARIDWLVDPQYVELLNLVESVDGRIAVDPRAVWRRRDRPAFLQTLRELRRVRYDAVIDLQGLLKSAVLARAARGGRTVGFPRAHLREPAARLLYTDAPDPGPATHIVHKNLALLGAVGVSDRRVRFPVNIPRTEAVQTVTARFASGGYALINPGAAWPNKRWPPDRFGAIAAALRNDHDLRSVVLWGPGDEWLAAQVVAASAGAAEPAPPTTITDVVGLARAARLMVSGDTGPLHIAGAVGTPIVALFGPTDPQRNGPWASDDVTISRFGECVCLYERRCRRASRCIDDIDVEEVATAIRRRIGAHA
jgi:lipopolysaccharide heptosyltransferase I